MAKKISLLMCASLFLAVIAVTNSSCGGGSDEPATGTDFNRDVSRPRPIKEKGISLYSVIDNETGDYSDKNYTKMTGVVSAVVADMKLHGVETVIREINEKCKYKSGDTYVWIMQADLDKDIVLNAINVAHPINKTLHNKDFMEIRDVDGKYFIKEIVLKAKRDGKGWVDYKWPHPVSKKNMDKVSYFERYQDYIILYGVYR